MEFKKLLTLFASGENDQTVINTTGTSSLSAEMKEYYDKLLIKLAGPALVHDQFGQKRDIPRNGGKTIEFRKFAPLPKQLTALTEGVTPKGQNLTVTPITATLAQYGGFVLLSDVIQLTAIDRVVVEATELIADQAGRTLDTITREAINGENNAIYAGGAASRSAIAATNTLKVKDVMKAVATLKGFNAKPVDDSYVAIIHPYVSFDLMRDSEYTDMFKYTDAKPLYEGEIGKFSGVRFVETTEAKIWEHGKDNAPTNFSVFSTLVLGKNAYGVTNIDGGGLEHIVKPLGSAGSSDPLNQRSSVGWKSLKTAKVLVPEYMVRIESTVSDTDFQKAAAN